MKYVPYFFVYMMDAYTSKHSLGIYQAYFEKGLGFLIALAVAVVIALLLAGVFYFLFGRKSHGLCSNKVWIVELLLCLIMTFFGTYYSTGVTSINANKTGKWGISRVYENTVKNIPQDDDQRQADKRNMKKALEKPLAKSAPIRMLCIENTVLAGLLFLFFSWFIRKYMLSVTNFAQPFPTFWPVKRKTKE